MAKKRAYKRIPEPVRRAALAIMSRGEAKFSELAEAFADEGHAVQIQLIVYWARAAGIDVMALRREWLRRLIRIQLKQEERAWRSERDAGSARKRLRQGRKASSASATTEGPAR